MANSEMFWRTLLKWTFRPVRSLDACPPLRPSESRSDVAVTSMSHSSGGGAHLHASLHHRTILACPSLRGPMHTQPPNGSPMRVRNEATPTAFCANQLPSTIHFRLGTQGLRCVATNSLHRLYTALRSLRNSCIIQDKDLSMQSRAIHLLECGMASPACTQGTWCFHTAPLYPLIVDTSNTVGGCAYDAEGSVHT